MVKYVILLIPAVSSADHFRPGTVTAQTVHSTEHLEVESTTAQFVRRSELTLLVDEHGLEVQFRQVLLMTLELHSKPLTISEA